MSVKQKEALTVSDSSDGRKNIIRKPRSNRPYINGQDMYKALVKYYEDVDKASGKDVAIPNYIGECIMKIAKNMSNKINFVMYSFKEDLIGDAIEKMIEAVKFKKFDPTLSQNPFAYFSQVTWNCFLQRIQKEKIEAYVKHKNIENMRSEYSLTGETLFENDEDNEDHNRVIDNFEKKKEKNNYAVHRNLSYEKNKKKKALTDQEETPIIKDSKE